MDNVYITTTIYYVNDQPHLGSAYTTLAADVVARYWRRKLGAEHVFLQVGTDEHGQKIAEAAEAAGQDPKSFVDSVAPRFVHAWQKLNIQSDAFNRTTDSAHEQFAAEFLQQLFDQGDIYKDTYEGLYCVGCEKFLTESELVDGHCPLHPNQVPIHQKEENYFFRLSKYIDQVGEALSSGQLGVFPAHRSNEVLARIGAGVRDLSISRQSVSWGIPVPWDPTQTFYVWVEALLNYASVLSAHDAEHFWPPTYQFIGKDILWFHVAIWPALLLAAGKPLPGAIVAHGFLTVNGQKMSKSLDNAIDPLALVDEYGVDGARYLLMTAAPFGSDGDVQPTRFAELYTSDLANGIGNLLNRTVTLISRANLTIEADAQAACPDVDQAIEELRLDDGLKVVMEIVRKANQELEKTQPWLMLKDRSGIVSEDPLLPIITSAYRSLESIAYGLEPYLPETSTKILQQLKSGHPEPLFPRK